VTKAQISIRERAMRDFLEMKEAHKNTQKYFRRLGWSFRLFVVTTVLVLSTALCLEKGTEVGGNHTILFWIGIACGIATAISLGFSAWFFRGEPSRLRMS